MIVSDVVYPSKKGVVVYIPIVILTAVVVIDIVYKQYWNGVLCTILVLAILLPMLLNTNYTIKSDSSLKVRCGFLVHMLIDISTIRKIEATKSILSSPSLSLDRLEVFYNKFDSVIISPQNKDEFILGLQNINPAIEYIKKTC